MATVEGDAHPVCHSVSKMHVNALAATRILVAVPVAFSLIKGGMAAIAAHMFVMHYGTITDVAGPALGAALFAREWLATRRQHRLA